MMGVKLPETVGAEREIWGVIQLLTSPSEEDIDSAMRLMINDQIRGYCLQDKEKWEPGCLTICSH